jgi:hypothetical protein
MKKQWIPLLVLALVLAIAPNAMANPCEKCKPTPPDQIYCYGVTGNGFINCDTSQGTCIVSGFCTGGGGLTANDVQPLAAEFTVASVERLDEPNTSETRVASLETAPTLNR